MTEERRPTHQTVADRLGLTVATVSRLRSGQRLPSVDVMMKIARLTSWALDRQGEARQQLHYHTELNQQLEQWNKREEDKASA